MLKDMRTQLNNVQSFLDAHVEFLENFSKDGSQQQQGQGQLRVLPTYIISVVNLCLVHLQYTVLINSY